MSRIMLAAAAALTLALAGAARAEVANTGPAGFQVKETVEVAAPAAKVWAALVQPSAWWHPEHTWSGDAKNLTFEARPDGCWCETFPGGGGAKHMTVIYVKPNEELRSWGALGPLSTQGLVGGLVMTLAPSKSGGTTVEWTFTVGGYMPGGPDKIAPIVDQVLKLQIERLDRYVETGKP
jgi:uncharacterized protein YndB with AHSA1/START domain